MENVELKIKQIYEKQGISISDNAIKAILKDTKKTKAFMRLYKKEEIKSINFILEKNEDNLYFSELELEFVNRFDLFDSAMIRIARVIWRYRTDKEKLRKILTLVEEEDKCEI